MHDESLGLFRATCDQAIVCQHREEQEEQQQYETINISKEKSPLQARGMSYLDRYLEVRARERLYPKIDHDLLYQRR